MEPDHRTREYWEGRYQGSNTPWQLGRAAPPLVRLLEEERARLIPGRAAVLGCGVGHEPAELARRGFDVVGVDWSESAVREASRAFPGLTYLRGDVRRLPFVARSLDYLVEHTCYCAIDPADRPAYVREAERVLVPGGRILGLFFEPSPPGDPPFAITDAELRRDFAAGFEVERLERARDSVPGRAGREWLTLLRRR